MIFFIYPGGSGVFGTAGSVNGLPVAGRRTEPGGEDALDKRRRQQGSAVTWPRYVRIGPARERLRERTQERQYLLELASAHDTSGSCKTRHCLPRKK